MLNTERYSLFLHYNTPLFKLYIILRSLGSSFLSVIVPDEIHESYAG